MGQGVAQLGAQPIKRSNGRLSDGLRTGRKRSDHLAARLDCNPLAHPLGTMVRDGVRDLM